MQKTKKPPAAIAGGGLGVENRSSGFSGFISRMRIGAANSHGGNCQVNAQNRRKARVGAGGMHPVDFIRAELMEARQECCA
jgi:hypothetical protein